MRKVRVLFCGVLLSASSAWAVNFDWAVIGNAGNAADTRYDTTGYGSVDYEYSISTTEVTTAQYVEFLNSVAAVDTYGLYNSYMSTSTYYRGIVRVSGTNGWEYNINGGEESLWANRPVVFVSWYDTLRFINWLNTGDTESGAYMFIDGVLDTDYYDEALRYPNADYWLPSEDEWYKAAYYDPVTGEYYDYATSSDDVPVAGVDANYYDGGYVEGSPYYSTEVGEYDNESPYGTYDQSGNVWEWNETLINSQYRGLRGGSWNLSAYNLSASSRYNYSPTDEYHYNVGFRVASSFIGDEEVAVPEPLSVGLMLLSVGGLVLRRIKKA